MPAENDRGGCIFEIESPPRQNHCICCCVLRTKLKLAGQLLERMEAAVRVHQHNDNAVKIAITAALMLEKVILGSTIEEAIQWASDPGYLHVDSHSRGLLQQALAIKQSQASEVAKKLGSSCHLPGSFQVSIVHCTA